MIPKIIHCIWFGGAQYPPLIAMCIDSWRKYCPDYEIKIWNEDNFDINCCRYVKEAHAVGKWAFVADYARLFALRKYGGIYMDTDVELTGSLDRYLHHKAFGGFCGNGVENNRWIFTALFGAQKGNPWIEYLLSYYSDKRFIKSFGKLDKTTNVVIITKMTRDRYGANIDGTYQDLGDVVLYPADHFGARIQDDGTPFPCEEYPTENSVAIHHCAGSWKTKIARPTTPLGLIGYNVKKFKDSIGSRLTAMRVKV